MWFFLVAFLFVVFKVTSCVAGGQTYFFAASLIELSDSNIRLLNYLRDSFFIIFPYPPMARIEKFCLAVDISNVKLPPAPGIDTLKV
jgi:hypothetical protein